LHRGNNVEQIFAASGDVNPTELLHAYRLMKSIREFETALHHACHSGGIPGFTHLYTGGEASATGICTALNTDDYITSTHRAHGHFIAKGGDLNGLALELYGRAGGVCGGKGGSMHIADWSIGMLGANAIVAASVPHALGAAFSAQYRKTQQVAVSFSGDGASNQGAFLESLNLAAVYKLPVVIVTEDNGYAETTASRWAVAGDLVARARAFGLPAERVDGSNFFAVHRAAAAAVARARSGAGASYLCVDLPMFSGHFEGDSETYRATDEVAQQRVQRDCLVKFKEHVLKEKHLSASQLVAIDTEVTAQVREALRVAQQAPFPASEQLLRDVYANYPAGEL
jgi:acetoin:2,6-dichlorophenolindophenol oxidoreductase subunit alpha